MGVQGDAARRNYAHKADPRRKVSPNPAVNKFNDLYNMYFDQLSELCTNRFKWEGLPDSVDIRFMERTLFQTALSVFYFEDRYDQFLAMRGVGSGQWNMYDNPTMFTVTGSSYVSRRLLASECVPIWANYGRRPDLDIVSIYATKLANLDLSLEINAGNARRGKIVATTENQKLSMANIVDMIDRGDPVIYVNKKVFEQADISVMDLGIHPDQLVNLHMFKTRLWSECMGLLGIDNSNQDKKERLVQAEVSANDGQTENMRRINLNAREQAADLINKRWPSLGGNVKVSYWVDEQTPDSELAAALSGDDSVDAGELTASVVPALSQQNVRSLGNNGRAL